MSTGYPAAPTVLDLADAVLDDGVRSAVLVGDPDGAGARLIESAVETVSTEGFRVVRLVPEIDACPHSMAAVRSLVDQLSGWMHALSVGQRATLRVALGAQIGGPPTRLALSAALLTLINEWARAAPGGLIVIMSAHMLDATSRDILPFIIRRLGEIPVTVLVSSTREDTRFDDRICTRVWYLPDADGFTTGAAVEQDSRLHGESDGAIDTMRLAANAAVAGDMVVAAELYGHAIGDPESAPTGLEQVVAESFLSFNRGHPAEPIRVRLLGSIAAWAEHGNRQLLDDALWLLYFLEWYSHDVDDWSGFRRCVALLAEPPHWARFVAATHSGVDSETDTLIAEADRLVDDLALTDQQGTIIRIAFVTRSISQRFWRRDALRRVLSDPTTPPAHTVGACALLANEQLGAGDWEAVERLVGVVESISETYDYHGIGTEWTLHAGTLAASYKGDSDAVRTAMSTLRQWSSVRGYSSNRWRSAHAQAVLALGAGNGRRAYLFLRKAAAEADLVSLLDLDHRLVLDLAEAAVAAGATDDLSALTRRLSALEFDPTPSTTNSMLYAGALAIISGERAQFARVVAMPDADRRPFDLARVRLAYGRRLRALRENQSARHELYCAADTFRALGATGWLRLAIEQLRLLGDSSTDRTTTTAALLTPIGRRVADLAATGLSNGQIGEILQVSASTVGTHLTVVYAALGVTSRAALRDSLSAQGISQRAP